MQCTSRLHTRSTTVSIVYNDLPRSSKKLTFRIFADDMNMYYSSKDPEQLQSVRAFSLDCRKGLVLVLVLVLLRPLVG